MIEKLKLCFAVLLGTLFLYAGISKVLDPVGFFTDIENYDLILWRAGRIGIALYLPWLEIICGVSVMIKSLRAGALIILASMVLIFTAALSLAWWRGLDISCGCFGGRSEAPNYLLWIGRDVGLLLVTSFLLIAECKNRWYGSPAVV